MTMDTAVVAGLQVQAMVLGNARDYMAQAQAQQQSASAPQTQQAAAILSLSAAAQSLLT
jgi:hypothetical protein